MPLDIPLADSDFGALLESTQKTIEQIGLPFLPKEHIHVQKLSFGDDLPLPYCTICPRPEIVDWKAGPTQYDDIIYGVMVAFVAAGNLVRTTETLGTQLYWRERAFDEFLNRDGTNLKGGVNLRDGHHLTHCYAEAGDPHIEPAARKMYDAQYWLLRFKVRRLRPT